MIMMVSAFAGLQKQFFDDEAQLQDARRGLYVRGDADLVALQPHPAYPEFADHYDTGGIFRFSGGRVDYNLGTAVSFIDFKNRLGTAFGGLNPINVVDTPPESRVEFIEMVVQANETRHGMLFGPETSDRLAQDFDAHLHEAEKASGTFYKQYAQFRACFHHARKTGAVYLFPST